MVIWLIVLAETQFSTSIEHWQWHDIRHALFVDKGVWSGWGVYFSGKEEGLAGAVGM